MPACVDQYFIDLKACDDIYLNDKTLCQGDPACLYQAQLRRQACEQAAYLKYIQCLGVQGQQAQPPKAGGSGCGCGGS